MRGGGWLVLVLVLRMGVRARRGSEAVLRWAGMTDCGQADRSLAPLHRVVFTKPGLVDWRREFKRNHLPIGMLSPDYTMHISVVRFDGTLSHNSRRQL